MKNDMYYYSTENEAMDLLYMLHEELDGEKLIAQQKQTFTWYPKYCGQKGYGYRIFDNLDCLLGALGGFDSVDIYRKGNKLIIDVSGHDASYSMVVRKLTKNYEKAEYNYLYNDKNRDYGDYWESWKNMNRFFNSKWYSKAA